MYCTVGKRPEQVLEAKKNKKGGDYKLEILLFDNSKKTISGSIGPGNGGQEGVWQMSLDVALENRGRR